VIARVLVGVLAVVVIAWFAVLEVDQRNQSVGLDQAAHGKVASGLRHLERAQKLNPDPQLELLTAFVRYGGGAPGRAQRDIEAILRREPDNILGWQYLARVARGRDPQAEFRAQAAIRRLDPLSARGAAGR
jgi:predicted Zn-dependent protease